MKEYRAFLDGWEQDPNGVRPIFQRYKTVLEGYEGALVTFKARPGVSYSLRGVCPEHDRDLFVMVDVVDDDPEERWLSVCFFNDQITDPDELGDWVPEGLVGEDACCFDISEADPVLAEYVEARIGEAWEAVRGALAG